MNSKTIGLRPNFDDIQSSLASTTSSPGYKKNRMVSEVGSSSDALLSKFENKSRHTEEFEDDDDHEDDDGGFMKLPNSLTTSLGEDEAQSTDSRGLNGMAKNNDDVGGGRDDNESTSQEHPFRTYEVSIQGFKFRPRPSSCVFVASLSNAKTESELYTSVSNHFKRWGDITVKVLKDTRFRPYSFVQFRNDQDAQRALVEAQNTILDGRAIRCEPARVNRTICITYRSGLNISYETIVGLLKSFGEIELIIASDDKFDEFDVSSIDRKNAMSKGWFCRFVYRDEAICAFSHLLENPTLEVFWTENIQLPQEEAAPQIDKAGIFVGQLSPIVTESMLRARFSQHGVVKSLTLVSRSPTSFAFIKYEKEVSAARAIERDNHSVFLNRTMHVQYKEIHPKENKTINRYTKEPRLVLAPPPVNGVSKSAQAQLRRKSVPQKPAVDAKNMFSLPLFGNSNGINNKLPPRRFSVFGNPGSATPFIPNPSSFGGANAGNTPTYDYDYYVAKLLNAEKHEMANATGIYHDGVNQHNGSNTSSEGNETISTAITRSKKEVKASSPTTSPSSKSAYSHSAAARTMYSPTTAASFDRETERTEDEYIAATNKMQYPQGGNIYMPTPIPVSSANPYCVFYPTTAMNESYGYSNIPPPPPKSAAYYNYPPYSYYRDNVNFQAQPPPSAAFPGNPYLMYYAPGPTAPAPPHIPQAGKYNYGAVPPAPTPTATATPVQSKNVTNPNVLTFSNGYSGSTKF